MVMICVLVELSRKVLIELCCLGLWLCSDASAEILVNHEMFREREPAVGFLKSQILNLTIMNGWDVSR